MSASLVRLMAVVGLVLVFVLVLPWHRIGRVRYQDVGTTSDSIQTAQGQPWETTTTATDPNSTTFSQIM